MPTTTTGKATDLITFSRGSLATVTDADGKIKWAPHNLLTNSEQFDKWSVNNATVVANAVAAPDGTMTADEITFNAVNASINRAATPVSVTNGALHVQGVWLRAKTGTFKLKITRTDTNTWSTATVSDEITLTTSWQLVQISYTPSSAPASVDFVIGSEGKTPYNMPATGSIYAWGAHLYRSDLGGMQSNASAYPYYNPSTPRNLLGYSEDWSNAYWGLLGVKAFGSGSITNAIAAPNGSLSADLITPDTANSVHRVGSGTVSCSKATFSVYVKANGYTKVGIRESGVTGSAAAFDLSGSGSVLATFEASMTVSNAAITSVGDGWFRISCTMASATVISMTMGIFVLDPSYTSGSVSVSWTANGTSGIYLWGAQLSDSASLDPYVPVFGAAPSAAAAHGPRLDYRNGSALGLLVEEARTNLLTYSNDFSQTIWEGGLTRALQVSNNAVSSPAGTVTAAKVYEAAAGAGSVAQRILQSVSGTAAVRTISVYAKKAERKRILIGENGNDTYAWFDLDLGTCAIATGSAAGTPSMVPVGDGWYRCVLTPTNTFGSATVQIHILTDSATAAANRVGDGASGVYMYGAQCDSVSGAAASFATSYIPTAAATVTRNADVASVGVSQFPYSASAGSIVVAAVSNGDSSVYKFAVEITNDARSDAFAIAKTNTNLVIYQALGATGTGLNSTDGSWTVGSVFKTGIAMELNSSAGVKNGGTAITAAGPTVLPAPTKMGIGCATNGTLQFNGWIQQITYLPRRISNAELQSRTA